MVITNNIQYKNTLIIFYFEHFFRGIRVFFSASSIVLSRLTSLGSVPSLAADRLSSPSKFLSP